MILNNKNNNNQGVFLELLVAAKNEIQKSIFWSSWKPLCFII